MATLFRRDDKPLCIFVVVIGFTKKELIKIGTTIEANGGLCSRFDDAQIVLAKREAYLPPALIQRLTTQVLLDIQWVWACVERGRRLNSEEDWGGYELPRGFHGSGGPTLRIPSPSNISSAQLSPLEEPTVCAQGPRFTDADDTTLVRFCRERISGALLDDVEDVLAELADEHPQHTAEEWRYRYRHNQLHFNARIFEGNAEALLLSLEELGTRLF